MERYTSCSVVLDLYDVKAKDEVSYKVSNAQPFSLNVIPKEAKPINKVATLERDYFLLDGSFALYDDLKSPYVAYMSNDYIATIEVTSPKAISSVGLTFRFWEMLPNKIVLTFYDQNNRVLSSGVFTPRNGDYRVVNKEVREYIYFAECNVDEYYRVTIKLESKDRYIRINTIEYGAEITYGDNSSKKIKSCSIVEQADILSSELPISESSLEVIDNENLFEITNPKSYYKYLQKRQKFKIYETIDDEEFLVATHYLKEWSQTKKLLASFKLQDVIGLLDETVFYGGIYKDYKVSSLIDEILSPFGITYILDKELQDITLSGYLPIASSRDSLKQVAFACGATVRTTKSDGIAIFKPNLETIGIIDTDRKLISKAHEIAQKDLITGVKIIAHDYGLESEIKELYRGEFESGTYTITFDEPCKAISFEGATLISSYPNYAVIKANGGEVLIKGQKYNDHKTEYSYSPNTMNATDINDVRIDNATLISKNNALKRAREIYEIKQYRLEHTLKIINNEEEVAKMYAVRVNDSYAPLLIRKSSTDLAGGYISTIEGLGYALRTLDDYRAGDELYTGGIGII